MPARIPYHRPGHVPTARALYARSEDRLDANRFYASAAWMRLRDLYRAEHPLCEECSKQGRTEAASDVHHIKERRDFPDLALDYSNLQALCKPCHNSKRH